MTYTLLHFAEEFRQLLLKAERLGFTVDDIGIVADTVLEAHWDKPVHEGMLPEQTVQFDSDTQ